MSEIEIRYDIPVPLTYRRSHDEYPLHSLEVGGSFFLPLSSDHYVRRFRSRADTYARNNKVKFTIRRDTEVHNGVEVDGVRCWRVE